MATLLCTAVLNHTSLLPADADQTSFVVSATGDAISMATNTALTTAITNFWNSPPAGGNSVGRYISGAVSRLTGAHQLKFYDITTHLPGTFHGAPVLVNTWTLTPPVSGADNVPAEAAVVATLFGTGRDTAPVEVGGTRPKSSRTGRIYVGPLAAGAFAMTTGEVRVTTSYRDDIGKACQALNIAFAALSPAHQWMVWSRRNAALYPVVGGRVDDAPDIIRRRGVQPSASFRWGAPG